LAPEEWGGETVYLPISALQKTGVEDLLEMILLVADMGDFRARREGPGEGAVLEAKLDRRRGSVATLLVQEGTLRVGDSIVIGPVSGKVRAMTDDRGRPVKEAFPSTPVQIIGLSGVPEASELFRVLVSEKEARVLAEESRIATRQAQLAAVGPATMAELSQLFASGEAKRLCVVLKADVQGSAEAITAALSQFRSEEVRLEILHVGVGEVTESDVSLAAASKPSVVIGFQVGADTQARRLSSDEHIEIRRYDVIYDLLDDVRDTLTGMLAIAYEEVVVGSAEVRALFRSSRHGTIAGSFVREGRVVRGAQARVMRNGELVHEGRVDSLRHLQEDITEIAQGFECGIVMQGFSEFETGDIIECLEKREVRRTLS
jgi:translation initiation factor IF-2